MKNIIKLYISIIFVMIVAVFVLPTATIFANSEFYGDISEELNFKTDYLEFKNLKFNEYSEDKFSLKGRVKNITNEDIIFKAEVKYYNSIIDEVVAISEKSMRVNANNKIDSFYTQYGATFLNGNDDISLANRIEINITEEIAIDYAEDKVSNPQALNFAKEYDTKDYVIDSFDVEIIVNEDGTLDITENIGTYFNMTKHGIYRKLPLLNTITRLDGTTYTSVAKVKNVEGTGGKIDKYKENERYIIKIGSKKESFRGEKDYTIKYKYKYKNRAKNYDEFYYNIVGTEWDTVIGNVNFKITMPKEFDASKLGFSAGEYGSINSENINYNVEENVITGSYDGVLKAKEGLTVRLELPDGYFIQDSKFEMIITYILYAIPIILAIILLILWSKYGKDNPIVETVEFYPPEGCNSLDVAYLYKGYAKNEDVVSLLIYLANKGYIKITEIEDKSLLGLKKDFKITKIKEYDGSKRTEKVFLDELFSKKDEVNLSELKNNFYDTIEYILGMVNNENNEYFSAFDKKSLKLKNLGYLMVVISFVVISIKPLLEYNLLGMALVSLLFPFVVFIVFITVMFYVSSKIKKVIGSIVSGFITFILFCGLVLPAILQYDIYLYGYIIGISCIIIMCVINSIMLKRTEYGNRMLGKIKGFKNFLETAEKERLEVLVIENPTYFYDILPYTYVLGISDKWIKKFETIAVQEPNWYIGITSFRLRHFSSSINNVMTSSTKIMSSQPTNIKISGGGFSGGGFGGGGGGSW